MAPGSESAPGLALGWELGAEHTTQDFGGIPGQQEEGSYKLQQSRRREQKLIDIAPIHYKAGRDKNREDLPVWASPPLLRAMNEPPYKIFSCLPNSRLALGPAMGLDRGLVPGLDKRQLHVIDGPIRGTPERDPFGIPAQELLNA